MYSNFLFETSIFRQQDESNILYNKMRLNLVTERTLIQLQSGKRIGLRDISENLMIAINPPLDIDQMSIFTEEVDEIIVLDR